MTHWLFLLVSALVIPILAAIRGRVIGRDRRPEQSLVRAAVHLGCLSIWAFFAAQMAASGADAAKLDGGKGIAVLVAGIIWVEAVYLIAARRRGQAIIARDMVPPVTSANWNDEQIVVVRSHSNPHSGVGFRPEGQNGDVSGESNERRKHDDELQEEAPFPPLAEGLVGRILGLTSLPLESIMTSRDRIIFVDGSLTADRALMRMAETRLSHLPVMAGGSQDRILGVVHAKDLVPLVIEDSRREPVRNYLRRWLRVPRGRSAAQLLEDFRRNRVHVGIVGDPMGRTEGIVTLDDIFRSIAGPPSGKPELHESGGRS